MRLDLAKTVAEAAVEAEAAADEAAGVADISRYQTGDLNERGHVMQHRESSLLTPAEKRVLQTFRRFLVTPGQMLCFYGPDLEQKRDTLRRLIDKDLLVKEEFNGAYSLTPAGFAAMTDCATDCV